MILINVGESNIFFLLGHRLFHCMHRALPYTFSTFNTESVVYNRETFGILGDCTHRARLYERTNMIVWAYFLIYLYHNLFLLVHTCKFKVKIRFCKIEFIYLRIEIFEAPTLNWHLHSAIQSKTILLFHQVGK